jgi:hypothetical protein
MRMMRQAVLQTWIDQMQAQKAQRRRERVVACLVGVFCFVVILLHVVNPSFVGG